MNFGTTRRPRDQMVNYDGPLDNRLALLPQDLLNKIWDSAYEILYWPYIRIQSAVRGWRLRKSSWRWENVQRVRPRLNARIAREMIAFEKYTHLGLWEINFRGQNMGQMISNTIWWGRQLTVTTLCIATLPPDAPSSECGLA